MGKERTDRFNVLFAFAEHSTDDGRNAQRDECVRNVQLRLRKSHDGCSGRFLLRLLRVLLGQASNTRLTRSHLTISSKANQNLIGSSGSRSQQLRASVDLDLRVQDLQCRAVGAFARVRAQSRGIRSRSARVVRATNSAT